MRASYSSFTELQADHRLEYTRNVLTNEPRLLRSLPALSASLFTLFVSDRIFSMFLFDCMLDRLFSMCLPLSLPVSHTHAIPCAGAGAGAGPHRCEFCGFCQHSSGHRGRYPRPCRIPHRHRRICELQRHDEHLHGTHHGWLHFRCEPQLHGDRCGYGHH